MKARKRPSRRRSGVSAGMSAHTASGWHISELSLDATPDVLEVVSSEGDLSIVRSVPRATPDSYPRPSPSSYRARSAKGSWAVVAADVAGAVAAALLAGLGYRESGIVVAAWPVLLATLGLYAESMQAFDRFRRLSGAAGVGALATAFLAGPALSGAAVVGVFALLLVTTLSSRSIAGIVRSRRPAKRTLAVGSGGDVATLADAAASEGLVHVVGYVDTDEEGGVAAGSPPALGDFEGLDEIVVRERVESLLIESSALSKAQMREALRIARRRNLSLWTSSPLPPFAESRVRATMIGSSGVLGVRMPVLSAQQAFVKRSYDVVLASVGLIASAPFLALIAIAIRVSSRGPVIYKQQRVTGNDRVFSIYKFRTMVDEADGMMDGLPDAGTAFFKVREDPRLTRVGRVLRRLSLDELPQLFNVLKGDLSMVGPRPLPVEQVRRNNGHLRGRHEMKAGVTGWWQVNGRSHVEAEEAVEMDLFYIENWSLWLDVYITLRTVGAVFRGGAY